MTSYGTGKLASAVVVAMALLGGTAWGQASKVYTLDSDFDLGTLVSVNHTVVQDQLQLDAQLQSDAFAYVAMPSEGVLLKVDSTTGRQVARYPSVYVASCPSCPVANNPCDLIGHCGDWDPSRTSVDADGNVWVANRAVGGSNGAEPNRGQGSITKIGNTTAGTCVDRNGNGMIDTSHDANDDGIIAENDPAEYYEQNDECLIKSIAVGPAFAVLDALAIDNDGSIWVGGYNTGRAYHIDPSTGALLHDVDLATRPFGFAIRDHYLYSAANGQVAARLDLNTINNVTPTVKHLNATCNYGMTVDQNGFMWTGSDCGGVSRCDFDGQQNFAYCANFVGDSHAGVTVDPDGHIWAAGSDSLQKYSNPDGAFLGSVSVAGSPYGIAVASDGRIFSAGNTGIAAVERGQLNGPPGAVVYTASIDAPGVIYNWGDTYSDMTGFIARDIQSQNGSWNVVQDGGATQMLWHHVTWNDEEDGFTGPGATLTVAIRAANALGDLGAQAFTNVASGADLSGLGITGRYVEVRVTFARALEAGSGPILSDIKVEGRLPNSPPVCSGAVVAPSDIWAPNLAFVPVTISGVTDPDGDPISISVTSIRQDEPVGTPAPDGFGVGTSTASVRAERSGTGDGRVYHVAFEASDFAGETCSGTVLIGVAHHLGGTPAVDGGPLYDSTTR